MIEIDIVLKIGDCEKQMPMDEARNLYYELNRLFNSGENSAPPPMGMMNPDFTNMSHSQPKMADAKGTTEHPGVTAARKAASARTGGCGCNKKKVPPKPKTKDS